MIYVLMIMLILLLWISFILNNKDLIAPSFLFCASFCFSCVWAVIYAEKWELGLHINTFFVIIGGVLEFIIISFIIKNLLASRKERNIENKGELQKIQIKRWKKIICIVFCVCTIIYGLYFIVSLANGSFGNIGEAIYSYRRSTVFLGEKYAVPALLAYSRYTVYALGFWFSYVLVNNFLLEKKVDILSLIIIILSMISSMVTGARGPAINILLGCIATYFILMNKKSDFYKRIRFKTILKCIIIGIIVISSFEFIGTLIGRANHENKTDYLAIYCGAEIKNLDSFLQEKNYGLTDSIWKSLTFMNLKDWLGPKLGINTISPYSSFEFRSINGFDLGNVYTTFYPYIYDYGFAGEFIFVGIMAIIIQWIYEKTRRIKLSHIPTKSIMIYSCFFTTLVLSFFSNKFYEQTFNKQFFINIILWFVFDYLFCKVKVRK